MRDVSAFRGKFAKTKAKFLQKASTFWFRTIWLCNKVATRDINYGILIKNTPESRTRLILDITMIIKKKNLSYLPLPLFTV